MLVSKIETGFLFFHRTDDHKRPREAETMAQMTGLNYKIQEMAHRIRELREIENFTIAEMANKTGVTEQEYIASAPEGD